MIESKYDKVYSQRTEQLEIYQFVEGKWQPRGQPHSIVLKNLKM